jgi:sRNA-binding regulator protein Hfq
MCGREGRCLHIRSAERGQAAMAREGFGGTAHYLEALVGKEVQIEVMNTAYSVKGVLESVFTDAVVLKLAEGSQLIFMHAICSIRDSSHGNGYGVTFPPSPC